MTRFFPTAFRPMLGAKADLKKLKFPVMGSAKLDGVRFLIKDGKVLSRSFKPLPNKMLQWVYGITDMEGLEGELIVGHPAAKDVYNKTIREVMTIEGPTTAILHVFDKFDIPRTYFETRYKILQEHIEDAVPHLRVVAVRQTMITNVEELLREEERLLDLGYEGMILKDPYGTYKYGRSTVSEGKMLKLKRFVDSEAQVLGVNELMSNQNSAEISALGYTQRSSHQENQVPMETMGSLTVRDLQTNVVFDIGTGFTQADRDEFWKRRDSWAVSGLRIKYKHFPIGAKDKPRHPVYLGIRHKIDM